MKINLFQFDPIEINFTEIEYMRYDKQTLVKLKKVICLEATNAVHLLHPVHAWHMYSLCMTPSYYN